VSLPDLPSRLGAVGMRERVEVRTAGLSHECTACRELIQQAREMLVRQQAISNEEANRFLYELAQMRRLFLSEAAGRIIAGEWSWVEHRDATLG
jgi:AmiR/NasT family two-component response regulator